MTINIQTLITQDSSSQADPAFIWNHKLQCSTAIWNQTDVFETFTGTNEPTINKAITGAFTSITLPRYSFIDDLIKLFALLSKATFHYIISVS